MNRMFGFAEPLLDACASAAFGRAESRPVLLLPGRLDAALAVWLVVGCHLLTRLTGRTEPEPTTKATLARKIASPLSTWSRRDAEQDAQFLKQTIDD